MVPQRVVQPRGPMAHAGIGLRVCCLADAACGAFGPQLFIVGHPDLTDTIQNVLVGGRREKEGQKSPCPFS